MGVMLVLGLADPVVITAEVVADTKEVLGGEAFEAIDLDGGGKIAIANGCDWVPAKISWMGRWAEVKPQPHATREI